MQTARSSSEPDLITLHPGWYGCPVDWRWHRAEWRLRSKSRSTVFKDDEWIRQAVTAKRLMLRGSSDYSAIVLAQTLYESNHWVKAEVEARVLANQPIVAISNAVGISQEVIEAFESLFFDVRRRLHAQDWVLNCLLGRKMQEQWKPEDVTFAWRCLGYLHGHLIVDLLVNGADRHELEAIGLPAYWSERSRLPKGLQLLLISLMDLGTKDSARLDRFINLGLCESLPRFDRPPVVHSLEMAGEHSWDALETGTRKKNPETAEVEKAA